MQREAEGRKRVEQKSDKKKRGIKMRKILLLTTSPTEGGNGDALIQAAGEIAEEYHAQIQTIHVRDLTINPCKGCYGCAKTGVCVQKDDMAKVLSALHDCDGLIAEAPVYYNCMAAQALLVVDRLCCTFACKSYQVGPKKKIGVFLTCTGSDVEEMKHHVQLIVDLPSIHRSVEEEKTEVFTKCISKDTCKNSEAYLERAREIARWVCE